MIGPGTPTLAGSRITAIVRDFKGLMLHEVMSVAARTLTFGRRKHVRPFLAGFACHIRGLKELPIRMIHVCSLARLHQTVEQSGARHVVTLLKDVELVRRPDCIDADNHLILGMDDINEPLDGYVAPADDHVTRLIGFVQSWDRTRPLVVHCYAGISRSTAGAFVTACVLNPARSELAIARE